MATLIKPATRPPSLGRPRGGGIARTAWPVGWVSLAIALFAVYQWYLPNAGTGTRRWFQAWLSLNDVNTALVYVILALGLNIVVGYAGLLDLGFVAFWAIGGYTAGWLMSAFFFEIKFHLGGTSPERAQGLHINFWLVLLIGGVFCALWGIIIGAPTLRLRSDYLALVTLGFGEIIPQVFRNGENINGFNLSNGDKGISPTDQIGTGIGTLIPGVPDRIGPRDKVWEYVVFVLIAAFVVFVSLRLRQGRLGRAWLAIREDELAASMMGVPLMRTKLASYAIGAFAGGLGGVAFAAHVNGVYASRFDFAISINLLAMVVLGGMGNVWGVMLGALVLSWINSPGLPRMGDAFNNQFGTEINFPAQSYLIFGAILVLMMLFRREGLLPETRTRALIHEPERGEIESVGADMEGSAEDIDRKPR